MYFVVLIPIVISEIVKALAYSLLKKEKIIKILSNGNRKVVEFEIFLRKQRIISSIFAVYFVAITTLIVLSIIPEEASWIIVSLPIGIEALIHSVLRGKHFVKKSEDGSNI